MKKTLVLALMAMQVVAGHAHGAGGGLCRDVFSGRIVRQEFSAPGFLKPFIRHERLRSKLLNYQKQILSVRFDETDAAQAYQKMTALFNDPVQLTAGQKAEVFIELVETFARNYREAYRPEIFEKWIFSHLGYVNERKSAMMVSLVEVAKTSSDLNQRAYLGALILRLASQPLFLFPIEAVQYLENLSLGDKFRVVRTYDLAQETRDGERGDREIGAQIARQWRQAIRVRYLQTQLTPLMLGSLDIFARHLKDVIDTNFAVDGIFGYADINRQTLARQREFSNSQEDRSKSPVVRQIKRLIESRLRLGLELKDLAPGRTEVRFLEPVADLFLVVKSQLAKSDFQQFGFRARGELSTVLKAMNEGERAYLRKQVEMIAPYAHPELITDDLAGIESSLKAIIEQHLSKMQ